jgi:hypothetical protein
MAVSGSTVALAFGAGNAIYFGISHDSGKTFSEPVKVQTGAGLMPVGYDVIAHEVLHASNFLVLNCINTFMY